MLQKIAKLVICAGAVALLSAHAPMSADAAARTPQGPACGWCIGEYGGGWTHYFENSTGGAWYCGTEGCHPSSRNGLCSEWHMGGCLQTGPSLGQLSAVVASASASNALIAAHPDRVIWNSSRRALQLLDCTGAVVAQVPLAFGSTAVATE
jgi:hypothetical protein